MTPEEEQRIEGRAEKWAGIVTPAEFCRLQLLVGTTGWLKDKDKRVYFWRVKADHNPANPMQIFVTAYILDTH